MVNMFGFNAARAGAVCAAVLAATALVGAGYATAAPAAATIKVTPSTGLSDGQTVAVDGAGFTANDKIGVMECGPGDWPNVSCYFPNRSIVVSDGSGDFSTSVVVVSSFTGNSPVDGAPAGAVDCTVAPGCTLRSGSIADNSVFADAVTLGFGG
ncbi:enediyne antibiotic chromoprotein [Kutzneria kofuensis]|uniref:Neocarzinostatin family protein n=1 Tax=Kutzneria kofuensis TaxID=103725 RepID=A0A7W9KPC5_9PSEU|nr:enediyne antibiotic chromoprotein [Kutzneria kofuensis]MBB5896264.1 hypothetical protein [Kutzneria kofuensis]